MLNLPFERYNGNKKKLADVPGAVHSLHTQRRTKYIIYLYASQKFIVIKSIAILFPGNFVCSEKRVNHFFGTK